MRVDTRCVLIASKPLYGLAHGECSHNATVAPLIARDAEATIARSTRLRVVTGSTHLSAGGWLVDRHDTVRYANT